MRRFTFILAGALLASAATVYALPGIETNKIRDQNLKRLISSAPGQVTGLVSPDTGAVINMEGRFAVAPKGSSPEVTARKFLGKYAESFKIPKTLSGFKLLKPEAVKDGISRVTVQQTYGGVQVFNSGLVLDVNSNGEVVSVCDNKTTVPAGINTIPRVDSASALTTLKKDLKLKEGEEPAATLGILDGSAFSKTKAAPKLAWMFQVKSPEGVFKTFIDAADGTVKLSYYTPSSVDALSSSCTAPVPKYSVNPKTKVPDFISFGPRGLWIPESATGDPIKIATGFFTRNPMVFGTGDVPTQLRVVSADRQSVPPYMTHVVLQQVYGGYPVFGAQLRVHISPLMTITSISGNYLRDPQVLLTPGISEDRARFTAVASIVDIRYSGDSAGDLPVADDMTPFSRTRNRDGVFRGLQPLKRDSIFFRNVSSRVNRQVQNKGLVVFPGVLSQAPVAKNDFAYWFRFPEMDLFVSAVTGDIVFAIPTVSNAHRLIYDANNRNELDLLHPPQLIFEDGQRRSSGTPNADASAGDMFILNTLGFFSRNGWTSYDNHDSDVAEVTNATLIFGGCPNAHWDGFRRQMWFCMGEGTSDILAHEFTHGVTQATAGLLPLDEPGALNEHYSDVMAEVAFPDAVPAGSPATWIFGEGRPSPRNMQNPVINNYANFIRRQAGCTGLLDVIVDPACDTGNVHANLGIGNRAAVLIADGLAGTPHSGIGRDRLGRLFLDTLTTRMHPWATYLDEERNTWATAMDLQERGVTITSSASPSGPPLDFRGVADEVSWAFTQVGVDSRLISGWFDVGGGILGGRGDQVFYDGVTLPAGKTVADVELVVRAVTSDGTPYWYGRALASTGGSVTFPGNVFGASITEHGIGTPNKRTVVHYFHSGFLPLQIGVNIIDSAPAVPLNQRYERDSAASVHWSTFGQRGDENINENRTLSGTNCVVDDVELQLLNNKYEIVQTVRMGADANAGGYGARLTAVNAGTSNETVGVHWWHDLGYAVRYRLHYYLTGLNCDL